MLDWAIYLFASGRLRTLTIAVIETRSKWVSITAPIEQSRFRDIYCRHFARGLRLPDVEKKPGQSGRQDLTQDGGECGSLGAAKKTCTLCSPGGPPGRRFHRARDAGRVSQQFFRAVCFR
jgi:hypothetical protein